MYNTKYTNPSKVTMGRFGNNCEGSFRYDGVRVVVTSYHGNDSRQLGDGTWLRYDSPVYKEYRRQACEKAEEQRKKRDEKRRAMVAQKKEQAKLNTMTALEWRVKLLTERRLYLNRRPYGCGEFQVFEVSSYMPEAIKKNMLDSKFIKFGLTPVCCYSAWGCYADATIQEVLDKVEMTYKKDMLKNQKEVEKALAKLA